MKVRDIQGVVTYAPPVEAFATGIKNFDRRNRPLITIKIDLDRLIAKFKGHRRDGHASSVRVLVWPAPAVHTPSSGQ